MCGFGSDGAAALLSACSFVCCCSHQFIFPCLEVLFQSTPPLRAIGRKALPGHSVDVDSLHVSYADIFVSQVREAWEMSGNGRWKDRVREREGKEEREYYICNSVS